MELEFEMLSLLNGLFHNLTLCFRFIGLQFWINKFSTIQIQFFNAMIQFNNANSICVIQVWFLVGYISAI